jgi:type I restriction enzyme, S subunit
MTVAIDITTEQRKALLVLLRSFIPGVAVWAYGSRVKWTSRPNSDLDLVVFTSPEKRSLVSELKDELAESSNIPFLVDLHVWDEIPDRFREIIRKEYVVVQEAEEKLGGAGEWSNVNLGDVVTLQRGFDLPAQNRKPGKVPIVSSSGISGYHSEIGVAGPGVVTGLYGTIGQVFLIKENYWPLNTTLWVKDFHGNDPQFTSYLLRTIDFHSCSDKSSVPGVNRNDLHRIPVLLPPIHEQHAITAVLGALDVKIESNRRTSRALERLVRVIFRAWFVDFKPVKAKAAGASSFPGMTQKTFDVLPTRLVESELGLVPEGWEVGTLEDGVTLTMGQSPPSSFYNEQGDGLPFHQGVSDYRFRFPNHRIYCTSEGREAQEGDVLLSVRAPVGRINVADRRLILGRGLAGLRRVDGNQSFLYYQLRHMFFVEDFVGDGTIYKSVTKDFLRSMPTVQPAHDIVVAFHTLVQPLDKLLTHEERESARLVTLRDYLLPKLLSGEVRVTGDSACSLLETT